MRNAIGSRAFLRSLFWIQNTWHQHGVLVHTLKVTYFSLRKGYWDLFTSALLHDIGKPFVANQKETTDRRTDIYSFNNHEEYGFHVIKKCPLISQRTKNIVRYHYLIRGIELSHKRQQANKHRRLTRIWNNLSPQMQDDLVRFKEIDDLGK